MVSSFEQSPEVAIITRTKNRPLLLKRTIEDVLAQTHSNWSHIIVNDGGHPDKVDDLVAAYSSRYMRRVKIIHNPKSLGMEAASNVGIHHSTGVYIAIHDDDDTWHPEFLERCISFLTKSHPPLLTGQAYCGVATLSMRVIESLDGNNVTFVSQDPFNGWMKNIALSRLLCSNTFPPISFLFKRSLIEDIGGFREDLPVLGDWDFHLRACLHNEIGLIREYLAFYHHRRSNSPGDYSNTVVDADHMHRYYENLYRNQMLRDDIAKGQVGLGVLLMLAFYLETLTSSVFGLKTLQHKILDSRLGQALRSRLRKFKSP